MLIVRKLIQESVEVTAELEYIENRKAMAAWGVWVGS